MKNPGASAEPEKSKPPDDTAQSDAFIKKAKELEADETGKLFSKAFKVVAPPIATTKKKK